MQECPRCRRKLTDSEWLSHLCGTQEKYYERHFARQKLEALQAVKSAKERARYRPDSLEMRLEHQGLLIWQKPSFLKRSGHYVLTKEGRRVLAELHLFLDKKVKSQAS